MTTPRRDRSAAFGYGLLGLIVFLFIVGSSCSKQDTETNASAASENLQETADILDSAAEAGEPVPLDASALRRGAAQLRSVASLDLAGSRQIFSRNCYDSLAMKFDWHQLDRCGGFDSMAVRWADQGADLSDDELAYFQSEAAATRFLAAAIANGMAAGDADLRWANLDSAARKLALPTQVIAASDTDGNLGATVDSSVANAPEVGNEGDPAALDSDSDLPL